MFKLFNKESKKVSEMTAVEKASHYGKNTVKCAGMYVAGRTLMTEGYGLANAAVINGDKKLYKAGDVTVRAGGIIGLVGVAGGIYNGTKFAESVVDMCTVENNRVNVRDFMNADDVD